MKFVGIVGSNAEVSYNRLLLEFIKKNYTGLFELDVVEIKDIPMFNQSNDQTSSAPIQLLNQKILAADGVIIATPEHNHTIPASLKSVLEWLSFTIHPLEKKPVMIIGASYYDQGSSRAQLHLRQILDAPGVDAIVMPGNEFLLGKVKEAFDENDQLKDQNTANFLHSILEKFVAFVSLVNRLEAPKEVPLPEEDLYATYPIETTIEGVDMAAEDWVEQAAVMSDAVEGDTYVKLNRGILTVNQINTFLMSMPMELTYADENNQFLYYNYTKDADMLAGRVPGQVGNPLVLCHPERALKNAAWVIQQLRSGRQDVVRIHVPTHGPDKFVVHNYQAMHDEEGAYKGVNEYILDFKPIVDWYLKQTGLTLEGNIDATTGASQEEETAEVNEEVKEKVAVDAGSGASIKS